jgi:hypothetical protein
MQTSSQGRLRLSLLGLLCVCLVAFAPDESAAAGLTGRTLQTWTEDGKDYDPKAQPHPAYPAGRLNGYLIGLADTLALVRGFCPPPGFGDKDMQLIVSKYFEHDLASRDQRITPRIVKVLQQLYPCAPLRKKSAGKDQEA